ncbi:MAG TPA: hypothetical protein VHY34_12210 [Caulobacteraceae bacterium]|jgi:hypothetical protein|nr:hypothetical protein [Caulobacteraceae bacterium]
MHTPEPDGPTVKTCPSAPPEEGSFLLGVVSGHGEVAYLNPHVPVTLEMLEAFSRKGVPVENRMRFGCDCAEHDCVQWKGKGQEGRCGLIDHALEALHVEGGLEALPRCGIRATCRWFAQHDRRACAVCPQIIRRPSRSAEQEAAAIG